MCTGRHFPLATTAWLEATQLLFETLDVGNRSLLAADGIVAFSLLVGHGAPYPCRV